MIKNFDKKSNWETKYVPNLRLVRLIGTRQLEVSEVNISDVHKILPAEFIISCLPRQTGLCQEGQVYKWPRYTEGSVGHNFFLAWVFPKCKTQTSVILWLPLIHCTKTCVYTCTAIVRLARLKYIDPLFLISHGLVQDTINLQLCKPPVWDHLSLFGSLYAIAAQPLLLFRMSPLQITPGQDLQTNRLYM